MQKKNIAILLILLASSLAHADGWSSLDGTNKLGQGISVGPSRLTDDDYEPDPEGHGFVPKPEAYSYYDVFVTSGKTTITYERQTCDFTSEGGDWSTFTCAASGKSPLAGATYKVQSNPKGDCSYQYKFVCVEGCNASTPKTMFYSWWECGDAE